MVSIPSVGVCNDCTDFVTKCFLNNPKINTFYAWLMRSLKILTRLPYKASLLHSWLMHLCTTIVVLRCVLSLSCLDTRLFRLAFARSYSTSLLPTVFCSCSASCLPLKALSCNQVVLTTSKTLHRYLLPRIVSNLSIASFAYVLESPSQLQLQNVLQSLDPARLLYSFQSSQLTRLLYLRKASQPVWLLMLHSCQQRS